MPADLRTLLEHNVTDVVSVPSSEFSNLLLELCSSNKLRLILPYREDEALALMLGMSLAGRKPLGIFQDTMVGNSQNILAVLDRYCKFTLKIWLGCRGGRLLADTPVHRFITDRLSQLLPPAINQAGCLHLRSSSQELSWKQQALVRRFLRDEPPGLQLLTFVFSGN